MPFVPQSQFVFCGPTYIAASPFIDVSKSVNLYPEPGAASSKTQMALIGRPGLSSNQFPSPYGVTSPVRGLWAGDNTLWAVGAGHVYQLGIPSNGSYSDYGAIANTGSNGPCSFADNGTQLLVCDPSAGNLVLATAPGTPLFSAVTLEYLDGFYVAIAIGSSLAGSNPNQINTSNNLDGNTWNALNYVIRTGAADIPQQLATLNGQLWIFGQKTTEIWYDAGNPGFPFARIQGATINIGVLWPYSVVKFLNTVIWVGANARGAATVYMAQGTNPVRVSNFAIEFLLSTATSGTGNDIQYSPYAYAYEESGHSFYVLNITGLNANNLIVPSIILVYDLTTGLWHQRTYYSLTAGPIPSCSAYSSYTSNIYVGDAVSAGIFAQNIQLGTDNGRPIVYTRNAPHVAEENRKISYDRFELDGQFGTLNPSLDYSNNGGVSFLGRNYALRQAQDYGDDTTFRRFYANQLGQARDRVFSVTIRPASVSLGTVAVTNGSSTVTGTGTTFASDMIGFVVTIAGVLMGTVATVSSATSLTTNGMWGGSTGSGNSYTITDGSLVRMVNAYISINAGTEA